MTTAIKRRRGTTTQHSTFTGLEGELTVDTTKDTVVVHDGATAGGIPLLREDLSNNTAVVKNNVSNTFTTNQIISANSTSDALRITQTGAGNALVVEDSANPDSTPFVVDANGNIASGLTNPSAYLGSSQVGQILKSSTAFGPQTWLWNAVNDTSAGYALFQKDRAGAIVQSGDSLANIEIKGYDGVAYVSAARITSQVDGTPGTNDMPGRLVFSTTADGASSPTEAMRIDSAGRVGIGGGATGAATLVQLAGTLPSSSNLSFGFGATSTIPSTTTSQTRYFSAFANTQAASFTLNSLYQYAATQGTFGAGSTVTQQIGYYVESSLTGATNNYGFYSNIAAGTGRWNFYAAGSADNYFAGNVGIGTSNPSGYSAKFAVVGNQSFAGTQASPAYIYANGTTDNASLLIKASSSASTYSQIEVTGNWDGAAATGGKIAFSTAGTEQARIDASGNLIHKAPTTPPTLATNGTMVFNLTSNTNLRVSVRGSDGVTRVANITLA